MNFNEIIKFDTNLTRYFFKDLPLSDLAHLKGTCQENNHTFSEIFKNHVSNLKLLFNFGDSDTCFVGKALFNKEIKPYHSASLFAEKSAYDHFLTTASLCIASDIVHFSRVNSSYFDDINTPEIQASMSNLFKNKEIFNILENFNLTDTVTNVFCNSLLHTSIPDQNNLLKLCTFINDRLTEEHHKEAAGKGIDKVYKTFIKLISSTFAKELIKKPLTIDQILGFGKTLNADSLININPELKELINSEIKVRERFQNTSSIKDRIDTDLPQILTPQKILETAYQLCLLDVQRTLNLGITPTDSQAIQEFVETECQNEKVKNLYDLEEILKKHIPDHTPIKDTLKNDITAIVTRKQ